MDPAIKLFGRTIEVSNKTSMAGKNCKSEENAKKPEKILACPRCHSEDTKFCYFNNYNVNQPRHFCKNCQRYWTAGGTTRNVPVGAGRRKNKQFASHCHQIILSEDALPRVTSSVVGFPHGGERVLKFGSSESSQNFLGGNSVASNSNPPWCAQMGSVPEFPFQVVVPSAPSYWVWPAGGCNSFVTGSLPKKVRTDGHGFLN